MAARHYCDNYKKGHMKQIPDEVIESTWAKLREWHIAKRTEQLRDAFELGDLLLLAVINTGLDKEQVAIRLREQLGELAYCMGTYRRAARIAEIFTASQRKVLIDKCVPISRVQYLASDDYKGTRRTQYIAKIKRGELTDWTRIQANRDFLPPKTQKGTLRHGITHEDDVIGIQVRIHGEFQRDLMVQGIMSWYSQVEQAIIVEMLNRAAIEMRKRGKDVRAVKCVG